MSEVEGFMRRKYSMSVNEKEELFCTQLVKYGVEYEKAAAAAKILASGKPDELLTQQEKQLTTEVCQQWATRHSRFNFLVKKD